MKKACALVAVRSFPKQFSYFKISLVKAQSASSSLFMQIQKSHSSQDFSANDQDAESRRPDYNEFTDQELKALVTSYGYKTRTNRLQKLDCLERLHDQRASKPTPVKTDDPSPDLIEPSSTRQKIRDYIRSDEALWMQTASYKAVNVNLLQESLEFPCTKDEVRAVLDEFAIFEKPVKRSKKGKNSK